MGTLTSSITSAMAPKICAGVPEGMNAFEKVPLQLSVSTDWSLSRIFGHPRPVHVVCDVMLSVSADWSLSKILGHPSPVHVVCDVMLSVSADWSLSKIFGHPRPVHVVCDVMFRFVFCTDAHKHTESCTLPRTTTATVNQNSSNPSEHPVHTLK